MTNKQTPAQNTKGPKIGEKKPKRDMFTILSASDLKAVCVKEYRFHPVRKWRFDYAFPEYKIALEVEGGVWTAGRHTRPQGFLGDIEKYNTAAVMGWRVFRVTPGTLMSSETIKMLRAAITGDTEAFVLSVGININSFTDVLSQKRTKKPFFLRQK